MEPIEPYQLNESSISMLEEYMENVLKSQNVETQIIRLINFGSLCYDYNQTDYAGKAYKLALKLYLKNKSKNICQSKYIELLLSKLSNCK